MESGQSKQSAVEALRRSTVIDDYRAFVADLSLAAMRFRPGPEEWSILEILHHLGDGDIVRLTRIEHMLTEHDPRLPPLPGPTPLPTEDTDQLIARFASGRQAVLARVAGLDEVQLGRPGLHPKTGPSSVVDQVRKCESHAVNHLQQCRDNLAAFQQADA